MKTKIQSWKEYFETHPEFVAIEAPKLWLPARRGNREMSRAYFGDFYLQRVTTFESRAGGYYDQHRIGKGDTHAVVTDEKTWVGDEAFLANLIRVSEAKDFADLWQKLIARVSYKPAKRARRAA